MVEDELIARVEPPHQAQLDRINHFVDTVLFIAVRDKHLKKPLRSATNLQTAALETIGKTVDVSKPKEINNVLELYFMRDIVYPIFNTSTLECNDFNQFVFEQALMIEDDSSDSDNEEDQDVSNEDTSPLKPQRTGQNDDCEINTTETGGEETGALSVPQSKHKNLTPEMFTKLVSVINHYKSTFGSHVHTMVITQVSLTLVLYLLLYHTLKDHLPLLKTA